MYKLMLYIFIFTFVIVAQAQQLDEETSLQLFFRAKYAVDRAAHAAAQQLDAERLSNGLIVIDEVRAREAALRYLQANLFLDTANRPLPGTMFGDQVEIVRWVTINSDEVFPYHYEDSEYDYHVELHHPGIILMIKVKYPGMLRVVEPMEWIVKGSGESTEL